MTSLETTIEVPQVATLADVPAEFWVAASIQILILVFGFWAFSKLIKLLVISASARVARRFSASKKSGPMSDVTHGNEGDAR